MAQRSHPREEAAIRFEDALMRFLRASRAACARVAREPAFDGITLAQDQLLDAVDRVGGARVAELAGVAGGESGARIVQWPEADPPLPERHPPGLLEAAPTNSPLPC